MKLKNLKKLFALLCIAAMMVTPVYASGSEEYGIAPCFNNISSVYVTLGFDRNNMVYCGLEASPYSHGSGISGLMFLRDSAGNDIGIWAVRDYEEPISVEFSTQGVYGETYTARFEGYFYSNNGTPPDRIEIETTAKLTY